MKDREPETPSAPRVYRWQQLSDQERAAFVSRTLSSNTPELLQRVQGIIHEVRAKKDKALRAYTQSFDKADLSQLPLRVEEEEFEEAEAILPQELKDAIDFSMQNIRLVQKSRHKKELERLPGRITVEHRSHAIESAGIYVPRGRGSFPSMVYMQALPAAIAGVPRIVMVTPPETTGKINAGCLYAAKRSGVHEVYRVGGAQSIAALAYGTESIVRVVKILGPGSVYVSLAKYLVGLEVSTGTMTGPSEAMIIADGSTPPEEVAQDLLIEAEHGSDSVAVLVTPDEEFAQKVATILARGVEESPEPQRTFLRTVFSRPASLVAVHDLEEAASLAEQFAPEHLMLHGPRAEALANTLRNAGEILCGVPFSVANYALGANAILPTHRFARSSSALSVDDFQRKTAIVRVSAEGLAEAGAHALRLADYEAFHHHAAALRLRGIT